MEQETPRLVLGGAASSDYIHRTLPYFKLRLKDPLGRESEIPLFDSQHILLVEDSQYDLELSIFAPKQRNLANPIDTVRDGAEALDYL